MKNNIFLLTILIFSTNAFAYDGIIHFRGSIVEDPCVSNMNNNTVSFNCHDSVEDKYKQTTFQINNMNDINKLPADKGNVVFKEIQKNTFLVTISYD